MRALHAVPTHAATNTSAQRVEAATLLSVKPSWIYEAVRAHRLPWLRVGRHIRFTQAMLERWLAEHVDG
jgi:excisionase family DNA binding protein